MRFLRPHPGILGRRHGASSPGRKPNSPERLIPLGKGLLSTGCALGLWLLLGAGSCPAIPAEQSGQQDQKQAPTNRTRAENELKEGARAYRARNFADAQEHFQAALELDPTQKNAAFFLARSIHAQYRSGVETPENIAKAREAIAAYERVLAMKPDDDQAYQAVVYLYGEIKEDKKQRDSLMKRARLETLPKVKRAAAYAALAGKERDCASEITALPENKLSVTKGGAAAEQSKKPMNQSDLNAAKQCATRGLEVVEKAIRLDPESEAAWSTKPQLLLELAKLAEREGQAGRRATYTGQAAEAQARATQLSEEKRKKMESVKSY
jgi:tetratricopeptide (TPR) repeat protein